MKSQPFQLNETRIFSAVMEEKKRLQASIIVKASGLAPPPKMCHRILQLSLCHDEKLLA